MLIAFGVKNSSTKGLCNLCQSDNLDLHLRSQLRLKFENVLTCSLLVMTLTMIQGHSGLAEG